MTYDDNKTRTWDRTTLNDGLYFEDEFSRVYDNFKDVDNRVTNMDDALSALSQYSYSLTQGLIQGAIYWDQTGGGGGAMAVQAGRYEVMGKLLSVNVDIVLNPVTHCYGNDVQEDDHWYYTLMDQAGNFRQQPAQGASVLGSLEVNSVTDQGGGNVQVTFRNSPDLSGISAGMIFRSDDLASSNSGIFTVSSVDAAGFRIQVSNNRGVSLLAETDPLGTGEIFQSVPLVNTPNPAFNVSRQGYYDGDWRILGIDHYESTRGYRWVRSFRSGYDKNDNYLFVSEFDGFGETAWSPKFRDVYHEWGHDYTFDGVNGCWLTFNRSGRVHYFYETYANSTSSQWFGLTLNSSLSDRQGSIEQIQDVPVVIAKTYAGVGWLGSVSGAAFVARGDVVRIQTGGIVPGRNDHNFARFTFIPD